MKAERFQDYWLKTLKNSDIGFEITEKDEEILKHLERIEGHKSEDETKLSLKFFFNDNEWFVNKEIIKEFLLEGDEIKKSYGDAIQWKEGKNITVKIVKKKQKNKKTGEKKVSTKEVRQESFFHLFDPVDLDDDDGEDEENEEEANQQVEELEHQHQQAESIYNDVIQNSLSLYLGVGGLADLQDLPDLDAEDDDEEEEEEAKPKKKVAHHINLRNLQERRKKKMMINLRNPSRRAKRNPKREERRDLSHSVKTNEVPYECIFYKLSFQVDSSRYEEL